MSNNTNMESIQFNLAIDRQKEFRAAKKKWLAIRKRILEMFCIANIVEIFAIWMYISGCIENNPRWGTTEVVMLVGLCVCFFAASQLAWTRLYYSVQRGIFAGFKK